MTKFLIIFLGGGLGSILRYLISISYLKNVVIYNIPIAILSVNILGSFIFGLFIGITLSKLVIDPNTKIFITSGVLAAFTTFSTFAWEAVSMIENELYINAFMYCIISVALSVLLCWYGYILGKGM